MDTPQIPSDEIQSSPPPPTITPNSIPGDDTQPPIQQSPPPQNPSSPPPPNPDPPQTLEIDDPDLDLQDDPEEDHEGIPITLSPSHHSVVSDSNVEEREALAPSRSSRKGATNRRKKKAFNKRTLAAIEKKVQGLAQKLKAIPFTPGKTLDFVSHEENLRRLGLWDFAHLEFDRKIRVDLLAKLIVGYHDKIRCSLVDDVRIMVNQADLTRALNLPSKKVVASWGEKEEEVVWPADFVAFVDEFVSSWMLLHEDTWMLPSEVMNWIGVIKEGHPEKVDYGRVIWFMVKRELSKGAQLESCYYASHLQHLIRVQKEGLFREKSPNAVEEVIMLKEDEEEEGDVKMAECDEVENIQPSSVEGIGNVGDGEKVDSSVDHVGLVEIQEKAVELVESSERVVEHVEEAVEDHVEASLVVELVEQAVERVESPEKAVEIVESPGKVVDEVENTEKASDDVENIETTCDHVVNHFDKVETANDSVDVPEASVDLVENLETAGDLVNDMNVVGDSNVDDMKIDGDNVEDMKIGGDDVEDLKTEDDVEDLKTEDDGEDTKITGDEEEDSKSEDDAVNSTDDGQIQETSGNDLMDFEPMRADDERDLWDLSRKDGDQDHFLRHCTMTEPEVDEDHIRLEEDLHLEEVDDDEDDNDEEHVEGFDALQKCNSFNGLSSGHLLQSMDPSSQMPYASSDFVNNDLMLGGPSSFFGSAPKRELDLDLDHDPEIPGHKRMRTDGPSWDEKPPDFDVCVDKIQQWIDKTRMAYSTSQETMLNQQQALFNELGAKEHTIQQLKMSIKDLQRRQQADLARYDNELYTMNSVVAGYRKALRSTQEKFSEYRKRAALVEEPLYKDAGEGGVVKTVVEFERERLKREEEERVMFAQMTEMFTQMAETFEEECNRKFEGHLERVEMYRLRVSDIEKGVEELGESMKKRKAPEAVV